jgi:hypothetical protein
MQLLSRVPFFLRHGFAGKDGARMALTSAAPKNSAAESKNDETLSAAQTSIVPVDYGTTGQLFDEIRNFLAQHPGLTDESVLKLVYFSLAILFPECAGIWPFVSVVASDSVGSSLLMRMIACTCLAPLHIGEVTLNAILTLPPLPYPTTVLIDQLTASKELERLLQIMSRPGGRIVRKGKFHDISFPTLVCTAEPLRDRWIVDQAIHVGLTPTRGSLPLLDRQSLSEFARKLRPKLARYRELNFAKVRDSHFDAPGFTSPTRDIATMLGNAIADDSSLQRCVLVILESQEQEVRIGRTDWIEAIVAEAVLFLSHEGGRSQARVGEITDIVNGILKGRGQNIALDPRAVGHHLRALGIFSVRLNRAGRGIRFTKEIRRKIHRLADAYNVLTPLNQGGCEFCAETTSRTDAPNQPK